MTSADILLIIFLDFHLDLRAIQQGRRSQITAELATVPPVSGIIYKLLNKDTRNLVAHYGRPRVDALPRGRRAPASLSEGFLTGDLDDRGDTSPRAGMS